MYSGTSMSSPHVAGLASLLKVLHPTWSPIAINSALMTSATSILDGGPANVTNPVVLFRQGAGHVSPSAAANPGLIYDHAFNDWLAFLCRTSIFFSSRRWHTRFDCDWSSDVCSSDLPAARPRGDWPGPPPTPGTAHRPPPYSRAPGSPRRSHRPGPPPAASGPQIGAPVLAPTADRPA